MLDKYPEDVRLVFKNFPLAKHKLAMKAATAALAAHKQGKFWEFHDRLLKNYRSPNNAKIQGLAKDLGLDLQRFDKDKNDPIIEQLIIRDMNEADRAGVHSIPTVFINGKLLKNRSLQGFQRMIDAERKKSR